MHASPRSTARARKIQLSIKALEVAEEKEAIAQYGSSDSGATLGDILGTALKRKGDKAEVRRRRASAFSGEERYAGRSDPAGVVFGRAESRSGSTF